MSTILPCNDISRYSYVKARLYVGMSVYLICISKDKFKLSLVFNLHTGECIHGRYFIAGSSVHTVGDVLTITKVSVIYTDKITFQEK